jgi:hypothetical protein
MTVTLRESPRDILVHGSPTAWPRQPRINWSQARLSVPILLSPEKVFSMSDLA